MVSRLCWSKYVLCFFSETYDHTVEISRYDPMLRNKRSHIHSKEIPSCSKDMEAH